MDGAGRLNLLIRCDEVYLFGALCTLWPPRVTSAGGRFHSVFGLWPTFRRVPDILDRLAHAGLDRVEKIVRGHHRGVGGDCVDAVRDALPDGVEEAVLVEIIQVHSEVSFQAVPAVGRISAVMVSACGMMNLATLRSSSVSNTISACVMPYFTIVGTMLSCDCGRSRRHPATPELEMRGFSCSRINLTSVGMSGFSSGAACSAK